MRPAAAASRGPVETRPMVTSAEVSVTVSARCPPGGTTTPSIRLGSYRSAVTEIVYVSGDIAANGARPALSDGAPYRAEGEAAAARATAPPGPVAPRTRPPSAPVGPAAPPTVGGRAVRRLPG